MGVGGQYFEHLALTAVGGSTYKTLGLQERRQGEGVVALVIRVRALGVVRLDVDVETVVVRDVGREAADLLALAGERYDLGELLGGCSCRGLVIVKWNCGGDCVLTRLEVVIPAQPVTTHVSLALGEGRRICVSPGLLRKSVVRERVS